MEDKNFILISIVAVVAITGIVIMIGFSKTNTAGAATTIPTRGNYNQNNHVVNICRLETIQQNGITCKVSVCYGDKITIGNDAICYAQNGEQISSNDFDRRTR